MKCRRIKDIRGNVNESRTVVWFGSYGKNNDGTAKFFNPRNKHDNYSDRQEAVKDSLIQRLSVIQNELWYNVSYGLPLHSHSKIAIDSTVASIILSHPDVINIVEFSSKSENRVYRCNVIVQTKFGIVDLTV